MPSGRTHDRITLWSLPVVVFVSLLLTGSSALTLSVLGGFLFGGLMLGPDLDTRSIHFRRWGWLRWIWVPYRNSIAHRSPLSHGPIIGTTLRVLYVLVLLGLAIAVGMALINELLNLTWTWGQLRGTLELGVVRYGRFLAAAAVGLELGALSHYTVDWGLSSYKQVRKRYPTEGIRALLIPFQPSRRRKATPQRRAKRPMPKKPPQPAHPPRKQRRRTSDPPKPRRPEQQGSPYHEVDLPDFRNR
ncbi:MAG: metal-binding protein [Cyanobacteria bacterium P01_A01_bin.135]